MSPSIGCETSCDSCTGANLLAGFAGRAKPQAASFVLEGEDRELFKALKTLRRKLADEREVPAYVVFSDATLRAIAAARPQDESDMLNVSGVGPKKLETYGEAFLEVVREFG